MTLIRWEVKEADGRTRAEMQVETASERAKALLAEAFANQEASGAEDAVSIARPPTCACASLHHVPYVASLTAEPR